MEILYNSDTFARLQDVKTGLYYQSPGYVYSFLANEIHFTQKPSSDPQNFRHLVHQIIILPFRHEDTFQPSTVPVSEE